MSARSEDPRPLRTRAAILAAVEDLSAAGAEITVASIVAEAGISRSTFYTQFRDLDALAISILTEAFSAIGVLDLRLRKTASAIETAGATTAELVAEFGRRRALYAGVLGIRTTADVHRAVQRAFAERALDTMRQTVPHGLDATAAADYVAGGTLAVLTAWLLSAEPAPPEIVQEQLMALLPTWLINEREDKNP